MYVCMSLPLIIMAITHDIYIHPTKGCCITVDRACRPQEKPTRTTSKEKFYRVTRLISKSTKVILRSYLQCQSQIHTGNCSVRACLVSSMVMVWLHSPVNWLSWEAPAIPTPVIPTPIIPTPAIPTLCHSWCRVSVQ